ncbi:MAG TPA: ABC transporter permease [Ktedonobacteraceae bacterium]
MAQQTDPVRSSAGEPGTAIQQDLQPAKTSSRPVRKRIPWGRIIFYLAIGFFVLNLIGMVGSVILDSFGHQWFTSVFPASYSTEWYTYLSGDQDIGQLIFNTLFVAIATTLLSLLLGFPASYVLARRQFRFKGALTALYMVPMLLPTLAYGIPLATLLAQIDLGTLLGSSLANVIVINVVPILPFVILILTPFIEQVDVTLESASRMLGANRFQTFWRIVLPLVIPGILTAGVLAIVRTIAMFELTFLVADASSSTLVVALFGEAFGAGIRPNQAIDALAVIYTATTMILMIIALTFVKPTQFVVRLRGR